MFSCSRVSLHKNGLVVWNGRGLPLKLAFWSSRALPRILGLAGEIDSSSFLGGGESTRRVRGWGKGGCAECRIIVRWLHTLVPYYYIHIRMLAYWMLPVRTRMLALVSVYCGELLRFQQLSLQNWWDSRCVTSRRSRIQSVFWRWAGCKLYTLKQLRCGKFFRSRLGFRWWGILTRLKVEVAWSSSKQSKQDICFACKFRCMFHLHWDCQFMKFLFETVLTWWWYFWLLFRESRYHHWQPKQQSSHHPASERCRRAQETSRVLMRGRCLIWHGAVLKGSLQNTVSTGFASCFHSSI